MGNKQLSSLEGWLKIFITNQRAIQQNKSAKVVPVHTPVPVSKNLIRHSGVECYDEGMVFSSMHIYYFQQIQQIIQENNIY